jgi:lipoprotein-anchoring transpeptidase ErfK/SrfK
MSVGIGAPNTPTPTGRFIVTDKLIPNRAHSFYGCCLLALSGRQPHLRPGWAGGDRIAIHGGSTGGAASAGCLHASDADLRRLMKLLPVGTPVYIRA